MVRDDEAVSPVIATVLLLAITVLLSSMVFVMMASTLDNVEKAKVIAAYPSVFFKDRSIQLFSESLNFDSAEFRGNQLLLPVSSTFSDKDLECFQRCIREYWSTWD